MRVSQRLFLGTGLLVAAATCGCSGDSPAQGAVTRPPGADTEPQVRQSADKRLIGRWRLDLSRVPLGAMTEQFRGLIAQGGGLPDDAAAHYTFDGREVVLSLASMGASEERRWYYEILRHSGDNLELQRHAPDGKKDKMAITVTDTHMRLHTGRALLELERVQ